ncbi:MAG: group II truncated hemoglobin [Pseudomonadota bacterium]
MQIEEKPPGNPPFATPFEWIGGEEKIRALVDRFYDLMDLEPAYEALRAVHGSALENARDRLFWFLCGWMGGPQHYTERFGHPRLRMRHMQGQGGEGGVRGPIGIRERDEWLACMDQAMRETGVDEELRTRLNTSFFQTADWMRNRGEG